jgi:hypothetical protein
MPNFDTVLLNKQKWCKSKHDKPFTFWYCVDNFYPWKDIVGRKVSKLRSIAELRAFYGNFYIFGGAAKLRWAGGAQRPFWRANEPKKTGARSARARTRGQNLLVKQ